MATFLERENEMEFESWAENELSDLRSDLGLIAPRPNQSLFKYISLDTQTSLTYFDQTLNELKLFGQSPSSLNDPFELNPATFNDIAVKNVRSIWKLETSKRPPDSAKRIAGLLDRNLDDYIERATNYLSKFRDSSRVISLSERYDSPLLWAHYANSYQGACIHFLGGKMQTRGGGIIAKVNYADQRPMYPLSLALALSVGNLALPRSTRAEKAETNKLLYFTKASDWSYEKEYRIVYNTSQVTNFTFNYSSIVSIILGPKMTIEKRNEIVGRVRNSAVPDTPIYEADVSPSNFSVQVNWSKPL